MAPRPPPKRSGLDKKRPGLDDMTLLTKPTPQGIRDNLKERLEAECIYTYIGNVLVAANPFTWLQIYSSDDAKRYMRQSRLDLPPHVFAVAEAAFRAMTEEEDSQCVIISGESGAGKTEASKHIQGYFALCSQGNSAEVERVKKVFLESNPLLEAFGNAKTLRNNNSSRQIAASRRVEAPSRHRRASSPGEEVVGGLFFDFEAIRTESQDRVAATDARTTQVWEIF